LSQYSNYELKNCVLCLSDQLQMRIKENFGCKRVFVAYIANFLYTSDGWEK